MEFLFVSPCWFIQEDKIKEKTAKIEHAEQCLTTLKLELKVRFMPAKIIQENCFIYSFAFTSTFISFSYQTDYLSHGTLQGLSVMTRFILCLFIMNFVFYLIL